MNLAHCSLLFWTVIIYYVLGGIWFAQIVAYHNFYNR